jgi:hypothetical protein
MAGCVDHDSNAEKFCERNAELLEARFDSIRVSEDVARFRSDELEKTMRYAEDATRPVRLAARDLSDAYLEQADLTADDDATEEELAENFDELKQARVDTREACAEFVPSEGEDA